MFPRPVLCFPGPSYVFQDVLCFPGTVPCFPGPFYVFRIVVRSIVKMFGTRMIIRNRRIIIRTRIIIRHRFPGPFRNGWSSETERVHLLSFPPAGVYLRKGKRPPRDAGGPLGKNSRRTPGTSRRPPGTSPRAPLQVWSVPAPPPASRLGGRSGAYSAFQARMTVSSPVTPSRPSRPEAFVKTKRAAL